MAIKRWMRRAWMSMFRHQRAEFYRDLADMYRRREPMMAFLEGEIANAIRTRQRPRAEALRFILARYQTGRDAGQVRYLMDGVAPRGDAIMLMAVDRADDKASALVSLAAAVDAQTAMKNTVATYAALPLVMLPLCHVLIQVLSGVILSIDRSTPDYVKSALWTGMNGWARRIALAMDQYGGVAAAALVVVVAAALISLPRWKGPGRLAVDAWPVYGLYRDFQAGLLFTSMAMLLSNGATLKSALEDLAQCSSAWMRWHLLRVLRALDDRPTGTIDAFSRGLLSPYMLSRAATLQRTASSFSDVLIELGTREGNRVLIGVRRAARLANVAIVGVLVSLSTFMGLATLTVPGKFSSLMEPSTLMGLKQAHEARAQRPPQPGTADPSAR